MGLKDLFRKKSLYYMLGWDILTQEIVIFATYTNSERGVLKEYLKRHDNYYFVTDVKFFILDSSYGEEFPPRTNEVEEYRLKLLFKHNPNKFKK
jgi:hypothetical protein